MRERNKVWKAGVEDDYLVWKLPAVIFADLCKNCTDVEQVK
jgi:hypothetical protein